MSTSSSSAQQDLNLVLPSCSFSDQSYTVSDDVADVIFSKLPATTPILDCLKLMNVSKIAANSIRRAISQLDTLNIKVLEPVEYTIVGIQRKKLDKPLPVMYIQDSQVTAENAMYLLNFLLSEMRVIRNLNLNVADPDLTHVNAFLNAILASENVKLEKLKVFRKKGGQSIPLLGELVKKNASTLKIVGRLGLQEAAAGLSKECNFERFSLMTFDLGLDVSFSRVYDHILEIARSGAKFKHLSYTSFIGFDPTDEVIQTMLDSCEVTSLRLTMMKGPYTQPRPDYMIGKVRRVTHLQLGEVVDKPNIFNTLVTLEPLFKKVFPHVEDIHFFQHW